ncbi:MAG: class I SAM-dependent methyltransferase [Haloferacaceae archaeon]
MTPDTPPPRTVYDRIATHFAATREHPWPEVEAFVDERVPAGSERALDLGCGNGRHAGLLAERVRRVVGVDASGELLRVAADRAAERGFAGAFAPVVGDAAAPPLRDDAFDAAVYVATVHHLRPRARRGRSLDELARVLRPGAPALVSAWSVAHDRFDADAGFDTTVDWTLPDGETVPRFYHVYDRDEFEADLGRSALAVAETFVSAGNCYAVVRGPPPDERPVG